MQHFRRISSLAEDFAKIGISGATLGLNESRPARRKLIESDEGEQLDTPELAAEEEVPGEEDAPATVEGLERVKVKKMKSGEKAKARQAARKNKAKNNRKRRLARKKAGYKKRMAKLKKMTKGKSAGPRMRFRLVQGMERAATMLESVNVHHIVSKAPRGSARKQVAEAMMKVSQLAGALGRRFAVLESSLLDEETALGIDVMHAGSAYGWESGEANQGSAEKSGGEVTDYAGDKPATAAPTGDKLEGDEEPSAPEMTEEDPTLDDGLDLDLDADLDDDDLDMDDADDSDMDDDFDCDSDMDDEFGDEFGDDDLGDDDEVEDDDDFGDEDVFESRTRKRKGRSINESIEFPMDHELAAIRVEAAEVALNLQQGNVSMGQAADLMGDMVSYLGGAMKLYNQLVQHLGDIGYIGQDNPPQAGGELPPNSLGSDPTVIGDGMPDGQTAISTPTPEGGAKTGDAVDGAASSAPEATQESRQGKRTKR